MKTLRHIKNVADPAMNAVRHMYQCAFPETERKPIEALNQMIQRSDYTFVVIEEQGETLGFAILFMPMDSDDAALLEYLAVDSAHQGSGAGTALVDFVIELTDARPLLVEVESSIEPLAERRRAFYRRNGFRKLSGLHFILPLPNSPAMDLMVVNGPVELKHELLSRWLRNCYVAVYQCAGNDSRLEKMMRFLPARIQLD